MRGVAGGGLAGPGQCRLGLLAVRVVQVVQVGEIGEIGEVPAGTGQAAGGDRGAEFLAGGRGLGESGVHQTTEVACGGVRIQPPRTRAFWWAARSCPAKGCPATVFDTGVVSCGSAMS